MPPIMAMLRDIREALGAVWRLACDAVVLAAAQAPSNSRAVCIVHLGAIGDFVLWLEAGRRLARHYRASGTPLVLLANAAWAPWARGMDLADEVWELDPARFDRDYGYRFQWLYRMRASGFDSVLQPTHSRTATAGDSLVRASAAAKRIGSAGDCANTPAWLKRRTDAWYTKLLACGNESRMELLRNADFMRGLGFADFRASVPVLAAGPRPATTLPARYAVLAPGAGWDGRAWPVSSFAEIGRRLAASGLSLVLAGGPGDRATAEALLRDLPGGALDLVGRTGLGELATVLAGARLVVANESAAGHIAAAAGRPVVCVLGGGHYGRFMPYALEGGGQPNPAVIVNRMDCFGCNWKCIYARGPSEPVKCIADIGPEAVWQQVQACLAQME